MRPSINIFKTILFLSSFSIFAQGPPPPPPPPGLPIDGELFMVFLAIAAIVYAGKKIKPI